MNSENAKEASKMAWELNETLAQLHTFAEENTNGHTDSIDRATNITAQLVKSIEYSKRIRSFVDSVQPTIEAIEAYRADMIAAAADLHNAEQHALNQHMEAIVDRRTTMSNLMNQLRAIP